MEVDIKDLDQESYTPMFDYCRQLIEEGVNPNTKLEVYRENILLLRIKRISIGAKLTVRDNRFGTPKFRSFPQI